MAMTGAEKAAKYRARHPLRVAQSNKKWRAKNPLRVAQYNKKWMAKNPLRDRFLKMRGKAKQRHIEFAIEFEDLVWPEFCPVLGIKLDYSTGNKQGKPQEASPSIDRLDNNLGYLPGNVEVISFRANSIKRDATLEELKQLVAWLETNLEKEQ